MWQFKFILTCVNYKILDELNFFHRKFSQLLINRSIVPLCRYDGIRQGEILYLLSYIILIKYEI